MELQLAIDLLNKEEATILANKVKDYINIVEIGTPIVINEGLPAVQHLNDNIDGVKVLADLKIMDAADYEVSQAVKFGADIVTILGVAEDASIKAAVDEAHKHGKQLLVDMIAVQDLEKRAKDLDDLGADYIAVHTGYDLQAEGQSPLESLRKVKSVISNSKVAVAGGIKPDTIKDIVAENPDLIIVGGGIANADDPVEAAKQCRAAIEGK
ncbi:3-hexulose-6-phosphate synthase [Staphylococcus saprophyticus]|uniref:3-hexulose-6-phosphate synthase 1 n=16 Tax=Staphylococcus TaxID=1279 RepID=HPS1_STAS1|nr:3-hexulose-6-phosphate synthase [Staphylococcus saprophyticus]Q49WT7.1 RecName: Full=3-hexulose-6-phosphate synthase 1; Short=HPS 1; AltName: Full=D-arabino-3-hexulose-6-phosphate formaldehyde lyase 1 [Staphylococcus saprophyticus subsp. saprophyticus ATCC 15305 = NCTC 7292]ASF18432.1 3-hexulose-6-phosphate synthase 1 [Staphylococcus saprophyticus]OOC99087.1 3-hexulose-6-phosphate synthase 1 [Staphylococcus saprophyticus subsp. saprophyticus ATCC 15305 = NCTC 7292]QCY42824.1 3-hexulose-6-pho